MHRSGNIFSPLLNVNLEQKPDGFNSCLFIYLLCQFRQFCLASTLFQSFCNHWNKQWNLLDSASGHCLFKFKINFISLWMHVPAAMDSVLSKSALNILGGSVFILFLLVCFFSETLISRSCYYNQATESSPMDIGYGGVRGCRLCPHCCIPIDLPLAYVNLPKSLLTNDDCHYQHLCEENG
jgi:hypothetical protein